MLCDKANKTDKSIHVSNHITIYCEDGRGYTIEKELDYSGGMMK